VSRTRDRSASARRAAAARWIRQRFGAPVTTDVSGSSRSPPRRLHPRSDEARQRSRPSEGFDRLRGCGVSHARDQTPFLRASTRVVQVPFHRHMLAIDGETFVFDRDDPYPYATGSRPRPSERPNWASSVRAARSPPKPRRHRRSLPVGREACHR